MFLELDIPASTTEAAPARHSYDVGRALIHSLKVQIPEGHSYLTHLEILSQGRPLYLRGERYITGDNSEVLFNEPRTLDGPPFEITLSGWNEDDTYSHTFYVEVNNATR